jgi:hypothetical protein
VQTVSAGMKTDKPNFTEWAARPPFRFDDEDEAGEGDDIDRL